MIAELSEANVTVEKATHIMDMAVSSLEQAESYKRNRDEEVAKLWKELLKERASCVEAWKTFEDEHRVH